MANNQSQGNMRNFRPLEKQKSFAAAFMQNGGQNAALQWLLENKVPVTIFFVTGVKFEGIINSFDQYTIAIVDVKGNQQLIYKDKISTLTVRSAQERKSGGSGFRPRTPSPDYPSRTE
ncbi:MAG: RNA chaperone Hfq [Succinivibrio sp.]|nr:RNA chaperone Hfq [Succinivibrio sp.]